MNNAEYREDLIIELVNWAAQASPLYYSQNYFGKFVKEFWQTAENNVNSFEANIISRIDSSIFGKYTLRRLYIEQFYLPPFSEFSVDTFYNKVGLGIRPEERENLNKKFLDTFSDIYDPNGDISDIIDFNDECWDIF
mgnify:CR=1 FL=1